MQKISPFLWFDTQAEEAASFYVGIFPDSKIHNVARYPTDTPGKKAGDVMTVSFELWGQRFTALNGGPHFTFDEAISFTVHCETQEEVDRYWDALLEGGGKEVQCGWLKDRFGLSWQITPTKMVDYLEGEDSEGRQRAFQAMMGMVKLDISELERAYKGA